MSSATAASSSTIRAYGCVAVARTGGRASSVAVEGIDFRPFRGELFAGHEEVHLFGDVGAVIADPFQILGDEEEVGAGRNSPRIFDHVGDDFAEERLVVLVHFLVAHP